MHALYHLMKCDLSGQAIMASSVIAFELPNCNSNFILARQRSIHAYISDGIVDIIALQYLGILSLRYSQYPLTQNGN